MNIIVYTKTGCFWCHDVLDFLKERHIAFEEKEVFSNPMYFDEMVALSGQSKAPTLFIDGCILADSDRPAVEAYLKLKGLIS